MNFDPTFTIGNVISIVVAIVTLIGIVLAFNVRVVKVEGRLPAMNERMDALERADETIRQEVRAVRAEVGSQFKVLQTELRAANEHMQNRLDSIFLRLGRTAGASE